eukprot:TRINITY_DN2974_c0_g4_i1.p1 TRINITY_DN2974_c0_g4~~TRINITY_DN2974_c0_g4_i1.p1  ORF type:complete len:287 (+),score=51.43 TRINITY_DN2974_c0_g4_i1:52-912(+)
MSLLNSKQSTRTVMCLTAALAIAVLCMGSTTATATTTATDAAAWPERWFGVLSTNSSNPATGETKPWEARLKWYDWTFQGLRFDGTASGATRIILIRGRQSWTYTTAPRSCVFARLPVGPVTPTWMQGGSYLGRRIVNSVRVDEWEKLDHLYAQPIPEDDASLRCVQVYAPLDPNGFAITDTYVSFTGSNGPFPDEVFAVPSFCPNTTATATATATGSATGSATDAVFDFSAVTKDTKASDPALWARWAAFLKSDPHAAAIFSAPEMRFALREAGIDTSVPAPRRK